MEHAPRERTAHRPLTAFVALLFLVLAPTFAAFAQRPQPAELREAIEVNVVNVDVHVFGRDGQPLTGLAADDFQLFENEKTKIKPDFFTEVIGNPDGEPRSLVVFVDHYNSRASNRDHALAILAAGLEPLLRKAPLPTSVVSYDGAFEVTLESTTDVDAVLAALRGLSGHQAGDQRIETLYRGPENAIRDILRQMRGNAQERRTLAASINGVFSEFSGYGAAILEDSQQTLATLAAFVRSQAMEPGRKSVIYLSDGFAVRPMAGVVKTVQDLMSGGAAPSEDLVQSRSGQGGEGGGSSLGDGNILQRDIGTSVDRMQQSLQPLDATPMLEGLAAEANTYRVTFYPIKAPPGDAQGAGVQDRGRTSGMQVSDTREALEILAAKTGGAAHTTETDFTGFLPRLTADLDHYYSLGFASEGKSEGELTPLRVKVKTRGAEVSYRESYIQRSFGARLADRTLGGLSLDQDDNRHQIETALESSTPTEDGGFRVTVSVTMPISEIGLRESDGIHTADARAAVAVLDGSGRIVAAQQLMVPLQIPAADLESARQQYYRSLIELRLPAGNQRLGFGLWDAARGEGSFVIQPLEIGAAP